MGLRQTHHNREKAFHLRLKRLPWRQIALQTGYYDGSGAKKGVKRFVEENDIITPKGFWTYKFNLTQRECVYEDARYGLSLGEVAQDLGIKSSELASRYGRDYAKDRNLPWPPTLILTGEQS